MIIIGWLLAGWLLLFSLATLMMGDNVGSLMLFIVAMANIGLCRLHERRRDASRFR